MLSELVQPCTILIVHLCLLNEISFQEEIKLQTPKSKVYSSAEGGNKTKESSKINNEGMQNFFCGPEGMRFLRSTTL